MKYITLEALVNFLLYTFSSLLLLAVFGKIYQWLTPYHEYDSIKEGKLAPAIALGGALIGFTLPLLSVSYHGVNYLDFLIWAVIVGALQIVLFKALYWIIPMQIEEDNRAIALIYAVLAFCVGLISAFSLIPSGS
jgi:putative membrane protein